MTIQAGDVLLYRGGGIYSWIIGLKTWHFNVSHVEVALDAERSAASRDRKGVGVYPHRSDGLQYVLRPRVPFQLKAAMEWYMRDAAGQPYGFADLLAFIGVTKDFPGMVCSDFATRFLRAGGVPVFNKEPSRSIAPFQFLTSELLAEVEDDVLGIGA